MDFDDIINEFHLNLNKNINILTDKDQLSLFSFDQSDVYKDTMTRLNQFSILFNETNQNILQSLKDYRSNLDEIQEKYNLSKNKYSQVLHYNIDSITDDLKTKDMDLTKSNESISNQDFRLVAKNRDILNNIDIDKNLINLGFSSYSPDITKHYNISKDEFAKQCNDNNNLNHAKISKEIYIINDMHSKQLKQYDTNLEAIKQSILNLTDEMASRKKRNEAIIYNKEVELNQKINQISAKYAEIRKLNEIQSNIELDSLKNNINSITEKYNKQKQELSLKLQGEFQIIDEQIDSLNQEYNEKINSFNQTKAIERFYKEKKYNKALKIIEINNAALKQHKGYKRKLKREYNTFLIFDKNKKIDLNYYENEYKTKINYLKTKKYLLDSERKYKSTLIDLDEEYEKYVAHLEIDYAQKENKRYNNKLDNNLSKDVNTERLAFDINKNKIQNSYQIWENVRNQSMSLLRLKAKNQENKKQHAIEVNTMNNEMHKQLDENKRKLNDLEAILNIEKNKYLVKLNNEIINHKIEFCNNTHSFAKANSSSLFEKNQNTLEEDKQFNESSRLYFSKHSDLIKKQETTIYLDNIERLNNEVSINRIKQKNTLNIKKLDFDNALLDNLINNISKIEINYKNIILDLISTTSSYLKDHLTNCELMVKVINNIINEFIDFIILLNENLLSLLCKIVNDRISFEVGNKYDKEISLINEKYDKKIKAIEEKADKANQTLSSYDLQLTKIYKQLSLNDELIKDVNLNEKKLIKENSKYLIKQTNKIINMSNNVNEAKDKIEYAKKRIEALRRFELDKIGTIKNADFIINNQAIIKADMLIDHINSNLNELKNIYKFDLIVIYKNFESNSKKLKKILNNNIDCLYDKMNDVITSFYLNEAKSIHLVYKNEIQRNQSNDSDRKKNTEKKMHDLERKIIGNNENYRFESQRHTSRLHDIELEYLNKLNTNKLKFNAINKSTHESLIHIKQKYFDIFNACDQNSNHIISTLINDNTNMRKNFAINLNLLEKKYNLIEASNVKNQEDYVEKLKKEKILLAKLVRQNENLIKNDYDQKNQALDQKIANYSNESVIDKKKKNDLIDEYQKSIKKSKEKERILYLIEKKNIIKKKNKRD